MLVRSLPVGMGMPGGSACLELAFGIRFRLEWSPVTQVGSRDCPLFSALCGPRNVSKLHRELIVILIQFHTFESQSSYG
jgi:hypothetical protein